MEPKVTIVMPVLNGARFIGEAIQSILAQTYRNYELIVVDDGSTDETPQVVRAFADRLQLVYVRHEERQEIARSMNDGVKSGSGDLVAFLDHDDAWLPAFLETQVSYLGQHPDVAMVHSDFQTIDAGGAVLEESVAVSRNRKPRPSGHVFEELFMDSFIVGNSVLIRRECFTRLGFFDESLRWGDYHMWLRIAKHYKVDYVAKVLTKYRQHASQSTRTLPADRSELEPVGLKAIKKILEAYPETRAELGERAVRRRMAGLYFDMAYVWFLSGVFPGTRFCLAKAIRLSPGQPRYYVVYAASLLRPSHALAVRNGWRSVRNWCQRAKRLEASN